MISSNLKGLLEKEDRDYDRRERLAAEEALRPPVVSTEPRNWTPFIPTAPPTRKRRRCQSTS
jgi:hypothetical protein